jgi:hypothetical protein
MYKAALSGDIIASTSMSVDERLLLIDRIKELFGQLEKKYNFFGRVVKGDYIECYIDEPQLALRIALIIKCFIKSISGSAVESEKENTESRDKYFKIYGVRIAIGIGTIEKFDRDKGIIEGEAISFSGRIISSESTHSTDRVVIKNTLFIQTAKTEWNKEFETVLMLIDNIIARNTPNQCQIIMEKLSGESEEQIALKLNITQSAVNQRSKSGAWNAIEKAVARFESVVVS